VLRESKKSRKDTRKILDGEPLRQSWELPFLSMPMDKSTSADELYCLYEAQISVLVTGIDHWVWVAYGFVDVYFDSQESVDGYDQMKGRHCRRPGRADPLAAGQIVADEPIWMPREYFLKVCEIRMNQVLREWNWIVDKVKKKVKQYVQFVDFICKFACFALELLLGIGFVVSHNIDVLSKMVLASQSRRKSFINGGVI
jgi:hypothetical protein